MGGSVGALVGGAVGAEVGALVGGAFVGALVGATVGALVGAAVGERVGAEVGAGVVDVQINNLTPLTLPNLSPPPPLKRIMAMAIPNCELRHCVAALLKTADCQFSTVSNPVTLTCAPLRFVTAAVGWPT